MIDGELELRPATLDDAAGVAELETARKPDDPTDPVMIAFWWAHPLEQEVSRRLVAERGGAIRLYVGSSHVPWNADGHRFGSVKVALHPDSWRPDVFGRGIETAEAWLQSQGAATAVTRVREDLAHELGVLAGVGYLETRRVRIWELDLVDHRDRLLEFAERSRAAMRAQGIELITLAEASDPAVLQQLYQLDLEATQDIPRTVPVSMPPFEVWHQIYFENPGVRKDRFWIARAGQEVAGMSFITYPPGRTIPSTSFTGTSPRFRGRGIARALKYETVAQAIALGETRVKTDNDSENAPILHLNGEMGYRPTSAVLELHRDLAG